MRRLKLFEQFVNTESENIFESMTSDDAKSKLEELFPDLSDLEHIGNGQLGNAFLSTIDNDLVVVKLTNSVTEYWLTQMAMVSDPPHVVRFRDVKVYDQSNFLYGIVHDYVNRDGMPDKKIWDAVHDAKDEAQLDRQYAKLTTNEQRHEFNIAKKYIKEVQDYFGIYPIDTLWQNWGYTESGELVIYDLDGYVRKAEYQAWMAKHHK